MTSSRGSAPGIPLAFLALLLVTTWYAVTSRSIEGLGLLEPADLNCSGTRTTVEEDVNDVPRTQVIDVVGTMRCELTVEVRNTSSSDVRLDRIELPFLGSGSGVGVLASEASLAGRRLVPVGDGLGRHGLRDARYDLGGTIAAHSSVGLRVTLVFNEGGCMAEGGIATYSDIPTFHVSILGRSTTVTSVRDRSFRGTADTDC